MRRYESYENTWLGDGIQVAEDGDVPPSATLRLRVTAFELEPDDVVEAGFDGVSFVSLECGAFCPADLDGDGNVGFADLLDILGSWGACPGCPQDSDGDAAVGFGDLLAVLATWGPC